MHDLYISQINSIFGYWLHQHLIFISTTLYFYGYCININHIIMGNKQRVFTHIIICKYVKCTLIT